MRLLDSTGTTMATRLVTSSASVSILDFSTANGGAPSLAPVYPDLTNPVVVATQAAMVHSWARYVRIGCAAGHNLTFREVQVCACKRTTRPLCA